MLTQPALALGKRLRMGIHHFDRFRRRFHGQQRVLDACDRLGLDVHIVFHEEIEALPHGALQDVLKRDHAERAARSKARAEALLAQKNLDKRDMQLAEARLRRALVRSSVAARKDI